MNRLIYTIYINHFEIGENMGKYEHSQDLVDYFPMMVKRQKHYADSIGADYKIFGYGQRFISFMDILKEKNVYESPYQSIQHFKFYLAEELKDQYDEILYMDLDVYPNTNENIFESIDVSKGIATHGYHDDRPENVVLLESGKLTYQPMERSISTKHALYNSLCSEMDVNPALDIVSNTGIMLLNPSGIEKVNYTNSLYDVIQKIDVVKSKPGFYAGYITGQYTYNNEAIFSYLVSANKVVHQQLGPQWHWVWNHRNLDQKPSKEAKFIHLINKQFGLLNGLEIKKIYDEIIRR